MHFAKLIPLCLLLWACTPSTPLPPIKLGGPEGVARPASAAAEAGGTAAQTFLSVVATVEPIAEKMCREHRAAQSCNIRIVIDDRPGQPPNAFQTLDAYGRPVIGFTLSLIAQARNADELAFVLGHEAAHHILGHIAKQHDRVLAGALVAGVQAKADGKSKEAVKAAEDRAAMASILTFSQDFELEADALGAEIAFRAGYDPIHGSEFFDRLPEPGNGFRSTHPGNAKRKAVVKATVKRLIAALP